MAVSLTFGLVFIVAVSSALASEPESHEIEDESIIQYSHNNHASKIFKCPATYGRYPHPAKCDLFFECRNGWPKVVTCSHGLSFDDKSGKCMDRRRVNCHDGQREDKNDGKEDTKNFKCPQPFGLYPHPDDCSKYITCLRSLVLVMDCEDKQLYDIKSAKCVDKKHVKCGQRFNKYDPTKKPERVTTAPTTEEKDDTKYFKCPYIWGTFTHPYDCSMYIVCLQNVPVAFPCDNNALFDDKKGTCLPRDRVNCGDRYNKYVGTKKPETGVTTSRPGTTEISTKPETNRVFHCPFPKGRFADPDACNFYYDCQKAIPYRFQCKEGELYDERKEICRKEEDVRCGNRPLPGSAGKDQHPQEKIECPYEWGSFVHRYDCSKYIVCVYNVPTIVSCGKDDLFDASARRCLPKKMVKCNERPNPDDLRPGQTVEPSATTPIGTTLESIETTAFSTLEPTTLEQLTTLEPRTNEADNITTSFETTIITTSAPKPNTPPPTNCGEDDLDCILDITGNVAEWFECTKRYGHYPHGSSRRLFIKCDNYVPFIKKCAEDTFFSPVYLVCVHAS